MIIAVDGTLVGILAFVALVLFVNFLVFFLPGIRRRRRERHAVAVGVRAPAQILEVVDTGNRVNRNPVVILKIEIRPATGAPVPAEITAVLSSVQLQAIRPGALLSVMYDPADPSSVAIVPPA